MSHDERKSGRRVTSFSSNFRFTFPPWPKSVDLISFEQFKPIGYRPPNQFEGSGISAIDERFEESNQSNNFYSIHSSLSVGEDQMSSSSEDRRVYQSTILQVEEIFGGDGIHGPEPEDTISDEFGPYDPRHDAAVRIYRAAKEWEISRNRILMDDRAYLVVWSHWKHFAQIEKSVIDNQSSDGSDDDNDDAVSVDEEGNISGFVDELDNGETGCRFLENIEETIRLFLSSANNPDLINMLWSDERIAAAPKIVLSFLKYVAAHKVLPEAQHQLPILKIICSLTADIESLDYSPGSLKTEPGEKDSVGYLDFGKYSSPSHETEVATGWGYDSEAEE